MQSLENLSKEEIKKKIIILEHSMLFSSTQRLRQKTKKRINELKTRFQFIK